MFFWYRNSFLASLVSIFGCAMVIVGIPLIASGTGILLIIAGVALAIWGKAISTNKTNKKWLEELRAKGMDQQVRDSAQMAVKVYQANPCAFTLRYIESLNPAAAQSIRQNLKK